MTFVFIFSISASLSLTLYLIFIRRSPHPAWFLAFFITNPNKQCCSNDNQGQKPLQKFLTALNKLFGEQPRHDDNEQIYKKHKPTLFFGRCPAPTIKSGFKPISFRVVFKICNVFLDHVLVENFFSPSSLFGGHADAATLPLCLDGDVYDIIYFWFYSTQPCSVFKLCANIQTVRLKS